VKRIDDELVDWASIKQTYDGHGLLIGNGASVAVWERFSYPSLYAEAPLTELDKSLFEALDSTNFELILDSLRISEVVCNAVGHDRAKVHERYLSIRKSLFDAVRSVHVQWDRIPQETFQRIEQELHHYEAIFSTNYDLLAYWSIMCRETGRIRDFFWNPDLTFDATNTQLTATESTILYLHGGIHLYVDTRTGATVKRKSDAGGLLAFGDLAHSTRRPLFISEGRSSDKLRSIRSSDYLSFAYQTLADYSDPLVIFGHSLGESDAHIAQAIKTQAKRRIAIGLRPDRSIVTIKTKTHLEDVLDGQRIEYFDATTHPLGLSEMRIPALQSSHQVALPSARQKSMFAGPCLCIFQRGFPGHGVRPQALAGVRLELVVHGAVAHEAMSRGHHDPLEDAVTSRQGPCRDVCLLAL
jgi:hypothetical protein